MSLYVLCLVMFKIKRSRDIEQDPGPKLNSCQSSSFCHWNINSILVHNFIKLSLLRAYFAIHKSDVACLSETHLNASISNDGESSQL